MTEDQSTPEDAQRPEGEPRFSFTDKRKVNPTDGSVRPSGAPAPQGDEAAEGADSAQGAESTGGTEGMDPIDAEAAKLFEQAAEDEQGAGAESAESGDGAADGRVAELEAQVAQLTEQLKREQAEYVNSRRRIETSAAARTEAAVGKVLASLISVLDDVELGRQHGDIAEGTPIHSLAHKLEDALRGHGMERYGAVGDPFDPNLHEALMHQEDAEVEATEIAVVMQPGYKVNDRVLRPARVGTKGPA